MSTGKVQAYYGGGRGKTSAALGYAIHEASQGGTVIIIQFLKQKDDDEISFIRRLEPEIRVFRFQKSENYYDQLSEEEQAEEKMNMKNGINYARKVLQTRECTALILDEVLGLVDHQVITAEELGELLQLKADETEVILTGRVLDDALLPYVDDAYEIIARKEQG